MQIRLLDGRAAQAGRPRGSARTGEVSHTARAVSRIRPWPSRRRRGPPGLERPGRWRPAAPRPPRESGGPRSWRRLANHFLNRAKHSSQRQGVPRRLMIRPARSAGGEFHSANRAGPARSARSGHPGARPGNRRRTGRTLPVIFGPRVLHYQSARHQNMAEAGPAARRSRKRRPRRPRASLPRRIRPARMQTGVLPS
jgi:hypothetical protein